jgi:hypothetical protein
MPYLQTLPTWMAVNNCNFATASGIQDSRTGQDFPAGGLNLGDYFDMTEKEANQLSNAAVGVLHSGRYRLVQVDSGATPANVKTGTIGYLRPGLSMAGVVITVPGTGATTGTYTIGATVSNGGTGAVIQVSVVGGAITSAVVLAGGVNYVAPPVFNLAVTGTTGGTVVAQLSTSPNIITSYDQAAFYGTTINGVVFLNSITPGNFGFVQEQGVATVLGNTAVGTAVVGSWVNASATGAAGTVTCTASTAGLTGVTVGQAIDLPVANSLFKMYITDFSPVQD